MQIVKIISLASALLIGGSLAGCDNKSTTSQQADKTAFITIGSGSTTAVYYPIANGIAKMINDAKINVKANARSTGGSIYNIKALQEGQLQMAIVQTDLGSYAHYGKIIPAFKTNPANKIEAIATLYPEVVHIVARKNRNINSVADLKGKRVYVGDIGSGVEQTAIQVLGAYGLTFKDIVPIRGSANLGAQQLQDNRAAAMFYTLGLGSAAIQQVAQVAPVKFLSIDPATQQKLIKEYPFYAKYTIPTEQNGGYKGISQPVHTLAVKAMLVVANKHTLPDKVMEKVLDALFSSNHIDQFKSIHSNLANFSLQRALQGVPIPLNCGAAHYYKERGVDVPVRLIPKDCTL